MHTVEVRLGQMGIITLTVCLHIVHFAREVLKTNKEVSCRFYSFSTLFNYYKHGSESQDYQFNQSKVSIDLLESQKKFVLF